MMTLRLTYPRLAAGLAAGTIVGLFVSGVAYAVTGNVFRYSTARTGAYSIHAAAMAPRIYTLQFTIDNELGSLTSTNGGCFQTGVQLPDRARVTGITVWYAADDSSAISALLLRNRLSTGLNEALFAEYLPGTGSVRKAKAYRLSGPRTAIANMAYGYAFEVCFYDPAAEFRGARIAYTYRDAGD